MTIYRFCCMSELWFLYIEHKL